MRWTKKNSEIAGIPRIPFRNSTRIQRETLWQPRAWRFLGMLSVPNGYRVTRRAIPLFVVFVPRSINYDQHVSSAKPDKSTKNTLWALAHAGHIGCQNPVLSRHHKSTNKGPSKSHALHVMCLTSQAAGGFLRTPRLGAI